MADDFDDEDKITIGAPIGNDILGKVEIYLQNLVQVLLYLKA